MTEEEIFNKIKSLIADNFNVDQDKITENNKLSYGLLTDTPDLSNVPDIPDLSDYINLLNSDTLPDEAINYIKTFKKIR